MRVTSTGLIIALAAAVGIASTVLNQNQPAEQVTDVIRPGQLVTVNASGRPVNERTPAEIRPWLAKLRRGNPPGVPYVAGGNLHDGAVTVALPATRQPQIVWTLGRVPGGWLIAGQDREGKTPHGRYGVLAASGRFDLISHGRPLGAALSPDRTQLVYAVASGEPPKVTVVDLATRRATASIPAPTGFGRVDGWNVHGIWLRSSEGVSRWAPGSPPQQAGQVAIHIPASGSGLVQQRVGDCDRLVSGDGLEPQIEYCGFSPIPGVLSPDAATFITPDQRARGVYIPRTVQLDLLAGIPFGDVAWEDPTHLLVTPPSSPVSVVRCDTATGACELALTATDLRLAPAD